MSVKYNVIKHFDGTGKQIQAIELLEEYPDVIYSYENAKFITVPGEEQAVLEFDYNIHDGHVPDDEYILFRQVIGDILVDIMTNGIMPIVV
jgi:hypothetical protein